MKAFVIGSSTYIGARLSAFLEYNGWEVFVDNPKTLYQDLKHLDVRFDLVAHCDTEGGNDPKGFVEKSMLDSWVIGWAISNNQPRMLYFSSADVYPERLQDSARWLSGDFMRASGGTVPPAPGAYRPYIRLTEDDARFDAFSGMPSNNAGWGSLSGELLSQAAIACGTKVHVVRLFSYYGDGLPNVHPFSRIAEAAKTGEEIAKHQLYISDWVHISDVVSGAMAVVEADEPGPVNICTGDGTSIEDMYRIMSQHMHPGWDGEVKYDGNKTVGQVGDPSLLRKFYRPKTSLRVGVKRALRWK